MFVVPFWLEFNPWGKKIKYSGRKKIVVVKCRQIQASLFPMTFFSMYLLMPRTFIITSFQHQWWWAADILNSSIWLSASVNTGPILASFFIKVVWLHWYFVFLTAGMLHKAYKVVSFLSLCLFFLGLGSCQHREVRDKIAVIVSCVNSASHLKSISVI